jgi:hypothetical protein
MTWRKGNPKNKVQNRRKGVSGNGVLIWSAASRPAPVTDGHNHTVHPDVVGKNKLARPLGGRLAGWETRETADWEVCDTKIRQQLRDAPTTPRSSIPTLQIGPWSFKLPDNE